MKIAFKIAFVFICCQSFAQQIPYISQITEAASYWNPAATAEGKKMNIEDYGFKKENYIAEYI